MDKIAGEITVANTSSTTLRISQLEIEGQTLLKEDGIRLVVVLAPQQSHSFSFEVQSAPFHLRLHAGVIEYIRTEEDIDMYSKANFFVPLLPFIKYNKTSSYVAERLDSLWNKITLNWQQVITPKLNFDSDLFPNSQAIEDLIPNLKQISEQQDGVVATSTVALAI